MESTTYVNRSSHENPRGTVETIVNFVSLSMYCAEWITRTTRGFPSATRIAMYFQHNGAPSHYTRLVMLHINTLSLIGGSVVAVTLTGHKDLQT